MSMAVTLNPFGQSHRLGAWACAEVEHLAIINAVSFQRRGKIRVEAGIIPGHRLHILILVYLLPAGFFSFLA